VAACEAGKDVYVEKPVSNNLEDGRKMVEAARKHNRVVQVGLQQRSTPTFQEATRHLPELGRISHVALNFAGGYTRPVEEPQAPPEDLDWEMFQGPAPRRPYVPSRQRSWRGYYDYGGGLVSDWGVHLVDVAHWYLGEPQPLTAAAAARYVRYQRPENDQVPDAFHIVWNYDRFVASFSNSLAPEQDLPAWGTYFYGERGVLLVNRVGYWVKPVRRPARPGMPAPPAPVEPVLWKAPPNQGLDLGTCNHVRNFLDATKSRAKPACDIETGFCSTVPTLLGVLSIRQGKTIAWDGAQARAV
jgi:predicted dehydrogenase